MKLFSEKQQQVINKIAENNNHATFILGKYIVGKGDNVEILPVKTVSALLAKCVLVETENGVKVSDEILAIL